MSGGIVRSLFIAEGLNLRVVAAAGSEGEFGSSDPEAVRH